MVFYDILLKINENQRKSMKTYIFNTIPALKPCPETTSGWFGMPLDALVYLLIHLDNIPSIRLSVPTSCAILMSFGFFLSQKKPEWYIQAP